MKNNNRKKFNLYTQGQRWTVRVLLIVGLFGSFVPQDAMAFWRPLKAAVVFLGLSAGFQLDPPNECPPGELGSCSIGGSRELQYAPYRKESCKVEYEDLNFGWEVCTRQFNKDHQLGDGWWENTIQPMLDQEGDIEIDVDFSSQEFAKLKSIKNIDTEKYFIHKFLGCMAMNAPDPARIRKITLVNFDSLKFENHEIDTLVVDTEAFSGLKFFKATNMGIKSVLVHGLDESVLVEIDISNNHVISLFNYMLDILSKAKLILTGNHVCDLLKEANITNKNIVC